MLKKIHISALGAMALGVAISFAGTGSALAQASIMKQCGDEWKAAKAANTVPAGQTWPKFLSECRTKTAASAPAAATPATAAPAAPPVIAPAKPAAAPVATAPAVTAPAVTAPANPLKPAAAPAATAPAATAPATGGRAAETSRQKQCGAEWRANKADLIKQGYATWPKYWSACNTRMKAAGQ